MATLKTKIRQTSPTTTLATIYFQIIHRRTVRRIATGIRVHPAHWDHVGQTIRAHPASAPALSLLISKQNRLLNIIADLDISGHQYTADDIISHYNHTSHTPTFSAFAATEITRKQLDGKIRTAQAYQSALNQLLTFTRQPALKIQELNTPLIQKFQTWLISRKASNNTISFYMRNLRAIFNRAVSQGLATDHKPFAKAYTRIAPTPKRAITLTQMRRIKNLPLPPSLQKSRDLFLLSFYCLGISFIDLANLKKTDIANGRITYTRSKTNQKITIAITPQILTLINKYPAPKPSPYLINIIDHLNPDHRRQHKNAITRINRHLKTIGRLIPLPAPLTTYVSRHTWASIAKTKNIRLQTISDALGHQNEKTTRIYLSTIDTTHIDRANRLINNAL